MPEDKRHPIEVVSRRTGLSKDLLRAWERRYGAVEPARSDGGRRLYSDADIDRLRLLRRATGAGRQIKTVVSVDPDELAALVSEDEAARQPTPTRIATNGNGTAAQYVAACLEAIERLDASRLRAQLDRAVVALGAEAFAIGVAGPLLRLVGERWHAGTLSPRHEHLASAALRGVLSSLAAVGGMGTEAPGLVVATPAGQRHEFGALLIAAVAATRGWRVTYLGADLPALDIAETATATGAIAVALSLVYPSDDPDLPDELRDLRSALPPNTTLLLGGRSAASYEEIVGDLEARFVGDLVGFRATLDDLGAAERSPDVVRTAT